MKLSDLQEMWADDCKIDETNLGHESARTPTLHSKYLNFLSSTRLNLRKAESDYLNLRRKKYKYFRGEMTQLELSDEGWDQWQGNKPLKNEMDEFLNGDADLIKAKLKIEYLSSIQELLESILQQIKSRDWIIRNSLEWKKFVSGA